MFKVIYQWGNRRSLFLNDDVNQVLQFDDMLGAKIISSSTYHMLYWRNWTTGTTYDKYEHNISSSNVANSGATNLFDSTLWLEQSFGYKVIDNNGNTYNSRGNINIKLNLYNIW